MNRTKHALKLLSSGLIVLLTAVAVAVMFVRNAAGPLTEYGLRNLKYFTLDSVLFLALVCLLELILAAAKRTPAWFDTLQYVAVTSVALTFTVVAMFFAPFTGYAALIRDANLYSHLIIPVLAMVSFCALRPKRFIPFRVTLLTLIPPLLYGAYYVIQLLIRGARFPETDWYGFAGRGLAVSVLTAAAIFVLTWALSLLLRLFSGGARRR